MAEQPLTIANVHLWDKQVGTVSWDAEKQLGHFTYSEEFQAGHLQVAPMTMPLDGGRFAFPELNADVFKGLPGFLSDSLPDKFGNAVINTWLAGQRRAPNSLNPVEQLCLIGARGMGALEYSPPLTEAPPGSEQPLDMPALVELINLILSQPEAPQPPPAELSDAMQALMQIGTSADGARAKAVVAYNPTTGNLRPGHTAAVPDGYEHWLLKFDGITGNRDREANDPQGWGVVEYAYHLMAVKAGIDMMECRLLEEKDRRHFITRRFDRTPTGGKLHRQSLCAIGHMDFDALGAYSYEEVLDIMRDLKLPQTALEEQFRRMLFNVLARNHDDHPKNIAFLMDQQGTWSLSPAYDLTFAYNPQGHWTHQHQMTLNGKRDNFVHSDFRTVARRFGIGDSRTDAIFQQVADAVSQWPKLARSAGVEQDRITAIEKDLRVQLL